MHLLTTWNNSVERTHFKKLKVYINSWPFNIWAWKVFINIPFKKNISTEEGICNGKIDSEIQLGVI